MRTEQDLIIMKSFLSLLSVVAYPRYRIKQWARWCYFLRQWEILILLKVHSININI